MPSYRSIANSPTDVLISLFNVHFFIVNLLPCAIQQKIKGPTLWLPRANRGRRQGVFRKKLLKKRKEIPVTAKKKRKKEKKGKKKDDRIERNRHLRRVAQRRLDAVARPVHPLAGLHHAQLLLRPI